jgi:cell division septation protein DedD
LKVVAVRRLLLAFVLVCSSAYADFSVILDAGKLRLNAATAMPAGSVLVLVAAGGDGTFSNNLSPGNYVSGNDILLSVATVPGSAAGFNMSGGVDETLNTLTINTSNFPGLAVGDLLALRWFPQISLTQFLAGVTPAAGNNFGTYNPLFWGNGTNNPDGGNTWSVPNGGATINLNFFTTDSGGGGTQNPTEGYASFVVSGTPTPTPTPTPTVTPTPTPTVTPTPSPTPSVTPTPSATPTPTPSPTPSPTVSGEALLNISTRGRARTSDNVLIGGFILGNNGATKTVVVRAIGPSLAERGVATALLDPSLQLFDSSGQMIASNNDWMTNANQQDIANSGLAPTDPRESALLIALSPGAYTAIVTGVEGTQNIALVEIYDLDSHNPPPLLNISTRGFVDTGDGVMIAGVIVGGTTTKSVVIRGLGPSLATSIANTLPNPMLTLYDASGQVIAVNDDWQDDPNSQEVIDVGLAPDNTLESAILVTLPPGAYTAILSDTIGATGVGLVEVYNITPSP